MITEDQLKDNPKMALLVAKAIAKDSTLKNIALEFAANQALGNYDKPYNKYGVSDKEDRTYKDGQVFASKKEMERYDYLLTLQRAGQIKDLRTQVPFELQEGFISRQWGEVKPIIYVADFVYTNISYRVFLRDREIVEDSKGGVLTKEYKLKRKMFLYKYGSYLFYEVK